MGFLDRFRRRQTVLAPSLPTWGGFLYRNGELATNETIFSAVSMLAGAIASLPVALRRAYERVPPEAHAAARLLEYGPNPEMTAFGFIRLLETQRDTTGAGYAIKELDGSGELAALWPVRAEYVTPMLDRGTRELYYRIRDGFDGDEVYLHSSMVLAVSHLSADGLTPVSPIGVLRSSLDYDREVKEFSIDQMKNGLRANLVINVRGSHSEEELERYNETLRRFRRSGVLYLDDGKAVQELGRQSAIDPKVFEVENITIARVARVYNIPLEKFLPDKTSYSSAEQGDLNYLRDTVLPMARMYEQEFTRKLLSDAERASGMRIKFSLNGFARADMKTRGEFYMKGVRTGWFSLDEVRELEDLPPLPGGQGAEHFISKDLVPVRMLLGNPGGREGDEK